MKNQVTLSAIKNIVETAVAEKVKNIATKAELIQFKDEILKEIETSRDEMTVTNGYGDKLENHDTRLSDLEKASHTHP